MHLLFSISTEETPKKLAFVTFKTQKAVEKAWKLGSKVGDSVDFWIFFGDILDIFKDSAPEEEGFPSRCKEVPCMMRMTLIGGYCRYGRPWP